MRMCLPVVPFGVSSCTCAQAEDAVVIVAVGIAAVPELVLGMPVVTLYASPSASEAVHKLDRHFGSCSRDSGRSG